jgi:hypothetical protein
MLSFDLTHFPITKLGNIDKFFTCYMERKENRRKVVGRLSFNKQNVAFFTHSFSMHSNHLKGLCHEMNIFLRHIIINRYLLYMR